MPAAWDANPVARAHAPAHNPGVATWRPLRLPRRNPQPTKDLRRQQRKSSVRSGWLQLRSEEHTSELQSHSDLVCRLLLEKKKKKQKESNPHQMHKRT